MSQNQAYWHLSSLLIWGTTLTLPLSATAQRIPVADDTLGNERSIVSSDEVIRDRLSNRIDGGARRGANLFHSFREFNIDEGRGAYFTNPDGVENILTRVTGDNRSDILGTLGVLGNADLFLINPNGILFGKNARLDIASSFVSSTADGFVFDNGFTFSTTNPQAPPLLTVSAPIGLQYGSNLGAIRVQGSRLEVPNGQTLTLAGGTVTVNGGQILAPEGQIELASLAAGEVGLTQQGQEWWLNVPNGLSRVDVAIGNDASVNVRAGEGGSIAITTRNLTMTGSGTRVRIGIAANLGTVGAQAGDLDISATEVVNLSEVLVLNEVQEGGIGNAGGINITTGSLFLLNRAQVSTSTSGRGNAGNITIDARDSVFFDGADRNRVVSGAFSFVDSGAIGQGGDIRIATTSLSFINGAVLIANTLAEGRGNAGNIIINARDSVSFGGVVGSKGPGSAAGTVVQTDSIGRGGNIRITTSLLSFTNGSRVSAGTYSRGNAGNIIMNARDSVSFEGVDSEGFRSGAFSTVRSEAAGRGGKITVNTERFSITNGAALSASSQGRGRAGSLDVNVRQLQLDQGAILTETASSQGGNITLQVSDFLLLRNQSRISVAGTAVRRCPSVSETVWRHFASV
jgi:filamentous hemagglutinin family protein